MRYDYSSLECQNRKRDDEPTLRPHGRMLSIAISRDNQRIVSASYNKAIGVWDILSGKQVKELGRGHLSGATSVAVSGDC